MDGKKSNFLKPGKIVILLHGRYAGRKAAIVKTFDEGTGSNRNYGHCLLVGIDKYPLKVTKSMGTKKKLQKDQQLNHLLKLLTTTILCQPDTL